MLTFEEVFIDETRKGVKLKTEEYHLQGKHIIVDQGQSEIAGYTDLEEGIYSDIPVLIFGDHTRIVKYIDKPFFLGADGVKVLKSKFEDANYKYLYYVLKNTKIPNTGYNRHFKWLKEIRVPYPEPGIQEQIVTILDKVQMVIDSRKSQLEELDNLIKSRFVELVRDNISTEIKLKDVVEEERIITYGIVKPGEHIVGGVPIIKVKDFPDGVILMDDMLLASREIESKYKRSRVKEGDLLFSIRGSVGRTAFVPSELVDANITQDTARISVGENYNPHYVRMALEYDAVQQSISEHVRGVAVKGISLAELREIEIPMVEKVLQDSFGRFVEQTYKLKVEVQKSLDETQQLMDSLMQKYFG